MVLSHFVETENLMYINIAIFVSLLPNQVLKKVIRHDVDITKVVINVVKDILLSSLHILDLLRTFGLKLWVHIDDLVEHVVGHKLLQIDVEDIFPLVRDKANDLILK
jgi:hypothetical protein